jgi:hypothetical protein
MHAATKTDASRSTMQPPRLHSELQPRLAYKRKQGKCFQGENTKPLSRMSFTGFSCFYAVSITSGEKVKFGSGSSASGLQYVFACS